MSLVKIITQDAKHVINFSKGIVKGTFKGLYAPYLVTTATRQHIRYNKRDIAAGERVGNAIGIIGSGIFIHIPFLFAWYSEGKALKYGAALLATNTLDYLIHAKRRSR